MVDQVGIAKRDGDSGGCHDEFDDLVSCINSAQKGA